MSKSMPRLTRRTLRVIDAIAAVPDQCGADLGRRTGFGSGTLYPMLMRLEEAGWISSAWEPGDPRELGRPRRRFYRMTDEGRAATAVV